jgi:hypothetical protein
VTRARTPLSRRELALAALALTLLGAALFGPQVARGGFVWDDWQNAANVHFSLEPGLFGALDRATERPVFGYRPVLTTFLVLEHHTLGQDPAPHLAMAALFGVLTAWALYLLLRTAGLGRLDSSVPSVLLLAFPWTDSTRLWATASYDTLAVALYLLGVTLAVRALRAPPGRARVGLTAASLVLYLMASWTYEIVTAGVLAAVALYLLVAPRRAALRRFALDAVLVAVALALVVSGTTRDPQSAHDQLEHARTIAGQSFSLLARALLPVGAVPGGVGAALLALVLAGAALAWRRLAPTDMRRSWLRRWLAAAGLGALLVAAGYALFVPALPHYQPLAPGTTNRMNVLAAVGFALLVYALVRLATGLLPRGRARVAAAALCALIGAGYVVAVARDERGWQRSERIQEQVLRAVRTSLPHPAPRTTIYTFGAPTFAARGIPVFSLPFDLKAAVRLRYDDASIQAYPVAGDTVINCAATGLYPTGGTYGPAHGAPYGSAVFVEVPNARAIRIASRAQCLRWRTRLGATPN